MQTGPPSSTTSRGADGTAPSGNRVEPPTPAEVGQHAPVREALTDRDIHLRLAADAAAIGTWTCDLRTGRVEWSPELERLFGLRPGAFPGTHAAFLELVHPDDRASVDRVVRDAIERADEYEVEFRYASPDGQTRWMTGRGRAFHDEAGRPLRIAGIGLDITDRKHVEQALRASEERFRQLAEAMPQIVFTARPDGATEYFNNRWYEFTGLTEQQTLAPGGWESVVHPDDRAHAVALWARSIATGEPCEVEHRFRDRTGRYRWHLARALPARGPDGRIVRWFGTCTDIDDQQRQQQRLAQLVEDLNRSNAELEEFAHIAAHDLKEPLRGIRNYASFLLEDCQSTLDEEGKRKLNTIGRLGKHMHDLLSALLYYAQVGRAPLRPVPTDLAERAAHVVHSLHPLLAARGARVVIPRPLPVVECDADLVSELFRNLISNAAIYTNRQNPTIEIGWSTPAGRSPADTAPVLYVRDDGIGIPPEHNETVFRIFERLHARDEYGGGAGAGLAIVKRIVERHQGRVWIESIVGQGTTVYFTLARPSPIDEPAQAGEVRGGGAEETGTEGIGTGGLGRDG